MYFNINTDLKIKETGRHTYKNVSKKTGTRYIGEQLEIEEMNQTQQPP